MIFILSIIQVSDCVFLYILYISQFKLLKRMIVYLKLKDAFSIILGRPFDYKTTSKFQLQAWRLRHNKYPRNCRI